MTGALWEEGWTDAAWRDAGWTAALFAVDLAGTGVASVFGLARHVFTSPSSDCLDCGTMERRPVAGSISQRSRA